MKYIDFFQDRDHLKAILLSPQLVTSVSSIIIEILVLRVALNVVLHHVGVAPVSLPMFLLVCQIVSHLTEQPKKTQDEFAQTESEHPFSDVKRMLWSGATQRLAGVVYAGILIGLVFFVR